MVLGHKQGISVCIIIYYANDYSEHVSCSAKLLPLEELVALADKWRSSFTHSIDSQDTRQADEVDSLNGVHSRFIH